MACELTAQALKAQCLCLNLCSTASSRFILAPLLNHSEPKISCLENADNSSICFRKAVERHKQVIIFMNLRLNSALWVRCSFDDHNNTDPQGGTIVTV